MGTPLSSLMNIKAVGSELEVDNSYCGAESGSIPVCTVSPAILLLILSYRLKIQQKQLNTHYHCRGTIRDLQLKKA